MKRVMVALVVMVGCGDNEEPGVKSIAAVCDEDLLPSELAALPDVTSSSEVPCGPYVATPARCFELAMRQPFSRGSSKSFDQKLFLVHRGCDRPMVVADWGYANNQFFDDELATLFHTNTLWIEHRFQGESIPAAADWDWKALTIENGANDTHHVIETLRHVYGKHWVATGASKGGITAAYHAYFYPYDVHGWIPYVAPASRSREDAQYQTYIAQHMTSSCAERVRDVQVAVLTSRHDGMIAKVAPYVTPGTEELQLDGAVATLDWGFWQYAGIDACPRVPDPVAASDDALFAFLQSGGVPQVRAPTTDDPRSDGALLYEWLTEHGFALQIGSHIAPLLRDPAASQTMEQNFAEEYPDVSLPAYDGSVTRDVRTWVRDDAKNMLLIYGELDPWSGGALDEPKQPMSARFFVPNASHGAQLAKLGDAERTEALDHAARMFNELPDMTALPRAIAAGNKLDQILMRMSVRDLQLTNPAR